jgi:hypothetical protein
MRTRTVVAACTFVIAAGVVVAACDRGLHKLSSPDAGKKEIFVPLLNPPGNGWTQDTTGLPDLIVDAPTLRNSWVVREEDFVAGQCSVEEGNIPTGTHKTLRFSVLIRNGGTADLAVGDPLKHMDPNGDGDFSDADGLFEFASCHHHFHFRNYAKYELLAVHPDGTLGTPVQSRKRGFCMLDTTPSHQDGESEGPATPYYRICGNPGFPGNQGISAGWGDAYLKDLPGQLFLLDDPAEPVPPGTYIIRVTANPPFVQKPGDICPVKDAQGFCHMFAELSFDNNVGQVQIEIPDRTGKTGVGPGAGNFKEQLDMAHHPEAHGQSH